MSPSLDWRLINMWWGLRYSSMLTFVSNGIFTPLHFDFIKTALTQSGETNLRQGFSAWPYWPCGLGDALSWGCPGYGQMFSSLPDLCPLNASSTPSPDVTNKNVSRHRQCPLVGAKSLLTKNQGCKEKLRVGSNDGNEGLSFISRAFTVCSGPMLTALCS